MRRDFCELYLTPQDIPIPVFRFHLGVPERGEVSAEGCGPAHKVARGESGEDGSWATVLCDSTLGFHMWKDGAFHADILVKNDKSIRVFGQNGGTVISMAKQVAPLLLGRKYGSVFYVPMSKSLPVGRQIHYAEHERAQQDIFGSTNLIATPEIMTLQDDYASCCYGAPYWDTCDQFYNKRQKLHLRKEAAKFFVDRVLDALPRGSLLICTGWNSSHPAEEFRAQLDLLRLVCCL